MNETDKNESMQKMFMDELFAEVEIAIERARDIQNRFSGGKTRQDAEFIELRLMDVAERLALAGQHAKEGLKRLHATFKGNGIGLRADWRGEIK